MTQMFIPLGGHGCVPEQGPGPHQAMDDPLIPEGSREGLRVPEELLGGQVSRQVLRKHGAEAMSAWYSENMTFTTSHPSLVTTRALAPEHTRYFRVSRCVSQFSVASEQTTPTLTGLI